MANPRRRATATLRIHSRDSTHGSIRVTRRQAFECRRRRRAAFGAPHFVVSIAQYALRVHTSELEPARLRGMRATFSAGPLGITWRTRSAAFAANAPLIVTSWNT